MKRYTVICRPDPQSEAIKEKAIGELNEKGYVMDDRKPEIVFVIGGDGTFIFAVHHVRRLMGVRLGEVVFYGIHTGTLGFTMDYRGEDYREFMDTFFEKKYTEIKYPLLQALYGDKVHYGLNEIRIENAARTQKLDVYINGEKFETFRGTGMCVCTQLGSTAYNRSLGGAVLQEGMDFIQLTEMAGIHHSKFRSLEAPFVLKGDTELEFRTDNFASALLGCDASVFPLEGVNSVKIHICPEVWVRMLRGRNVSYFERLKSLF